MYNAPEQFAELNKASVQSVLRLAYLGLENAEKLARLNVEHAKVVLEDGVKNAESIASVKDFQDVLAMRSKLTEDSVQKAVAYSREVYEVASRTQAEFSALVEASLAAYSKGVASWVEKASQSAPAGSDVAVTALKSTVAATTAAIDQFTKATRQVVTFADASVRAAGKTAEQAAASVQTTKAKKAA